MSLLKLVCTLIKAVNYVCARVYAAMVFSSLPRDKHVYFLGKVIPGLQQSKRFMKELNPQSFMLILPEGSLGGGGGGNDCHATE